NACARESPRLTPAAESLGETLGFPLLRAMVTLRSMYTRHFKRQPSRKQRKGQAMIGVLRAVVPYCLRQRYSQRESIASAGDVVRLRRVYGLGGLGAARFRRRAVVLTLAAVSVIAAAVPSVASASALEPHAVRSLRVTPGSEMGVSAAPAGLQAA